MEAAKVGYEWMARRNLVSLMTKWTNERNETTKGMNEMMLRVLKVWPEKKEMTNNNYHTTSMAAVVVWIIIFETSSTGLPVAVSNPVWS